MKIDWNPSDPDQALVVETRGDFQTKHPDIYAKTILGRFQEPEKFCRVIRYQNVMSGIFVVPERKHPIKKQVVFMFALQENTLYFVGDKKEVSDLLSQFFSRYDMDYKTPLSFLIGFMNFMIREDVYFLEDYDIRLENLEECVFQGKPVKMEVFIMETRRDMDVLNNYYIQLNAVGETMEEFLYTENNQDLLDEITLYLSRIQSLLNFVQNIKEDTTAIWNLRQTQLSDRQNLISTILTIITAIFLPLTLITGWFGMNFMDMPLIHTKSGYYIIVGLCVLLIVLELIFIYSRHWIQKEDNNTGK